LDAVKTVCPLSGLGRDSQSSGPEETTAMTKKSDSQSIKKKKNKSDEIIKLILETQHVKHKFTRPHADKM